MAEKEYIEREETIAKMKENSLKMFNSFYKGYIKAIKDLIDMPVADVVEVVRCKDCKHYSGKYCLLDEDVTDDRRNPNDYCSYGERKELDNDT